MTMFDKLQRGVCVCVCVCAWQDFSAFCENLLMTKLPPPFYREKEELELKKKIDAEKQRIQQENERLEKEMK